MMVGVGPDNLQTADSIELYRCGHWRHFPFLAMSYLASLLTIKVTKTCLNFLQKSTSTTGN